MQTADSQKSIQQTATTVDATPEAVTQDASGTESSDTAPAGSGAAVTTSSPTTADADPVDPPLPADATIDQGSLFLSNAPLQPKATETVTVVIVVKLPQGTKNYQRTDLSGEVEGTDGYRQDLQSSVDGATNKIFPAFFTVKDTEASLIVSIPGGLSGVKTTVTVHSNLLNATKTLDFIVP